MKVYSLYQMITFLRKYLGGSSSISMVDINIFSINHCVEQILHIWVSHWLKICEFHNNKFSMNQKYEAHNGRNNPGCTVRKL